MLLGHVAGQQVILPHSPEEHFQDLFQRCIRRSQVAYLVVLEHGKNSFIERKISKHKVAEVAKTYSDQPELSHTAQSNMASMDEVWVNFEKHTSWYDSELVEAVVNLYGAESDRRNLEEFKNQLAQLKPFLNGSINSAQRKMTTRVLKLEDEFKEFSHKRSKQVCLALCDMHVGNRSVLP